jgi:hypothetical protein
VRQIMLAIVVVVLLVAPARAVGPGYTYVCTDGVPSWWTDNPTWSEYGVFPIVGWTFHSGGAAILHYELRMDRIDVNSKRIVVARSVETYSRPDVQALFKPSGYPVGDNVGWVATVVGRIPLGTHTFSMCVQDADHGALWLCSAPSPTYLFE